MKNGIESGSRHSGLLAAGVLIVATVLSPGLRTPASAGPTIEPQPAVIPEEIKIEKGGILTKFKPHSSALRL